ncbi:MAG: aldehyde dehydrogenase family protein [Peptostreptococcaceae bacterium]|nr:aldehyde dehydrogenase family protein [Peptostreptococcaceae bacterium]
MERLKLYIDGIWTEADGREIIEVLNPESHEVIAKVPRCNEKDVNRGVAAAKKAFVTWQYTPLEERLSLMEKVVQGMKDNRELFIKTISAELGCPIKVAAESHTNPSILEAENYVRIAREFNYEERRETSVVRREPVGVVAGLTPWNFPFEQIEKKVVPALLAGCCVILKPSQQTPLTAYLLADLIEKVGYPAGVFNLIPGRGAEVGNVLALHPDVDMISFTGSTNAGREVGRFALSNIKRIALELGGKSAAILLKGGDSEFAVKSVLDTVVPNAGQTCNALTRLLVPKDELKSVENIILEQLKNYKCGANSDYDTDQGPLASQKQFDRVKKYIQIGIDEGARLLTGGLPKEGKDFYVEPTVFVDVEPAMRIAQEEIFGPVLVVISYDTVDEAVEIANDSIYGLGGAVFGSEEEANAVARRIRTGTIYVNRGQYDIESPFGGYKQSGIGREGGTEGYEEFLEVKTIYDC